jgi:CubicO group peptidase (beta-lactamase class C family)
MMGSDVLGSIPASPAEIWSGYGFGLSVEVDRGPGGAATPVSAGSFDWGGAGSTWMWVDPKTGVTGLLMLQVFPSSPRWAQLFKQVVYGALVDPG